MNNGDRMDLKTDSIFEMATGARKQEASRYNRTNHWDEEVCQQKHHRIVNELRDFQSSTSIHGIQYIWTHGNESWLGTIFWVRNFTCI